MTDIYDRATAHEEFERNLALQNQASKTGLSDKRIADSAINCSDCGESIPDNRREAMPGCQRCIDCQTIAEKHK